MGTYAKDNYESASRAALVGGTTTLIEMACNPPAVKSRWPRRELWKSKAAGNTILRLYLPLWAPPALRLAGRKPVKGNRRRGHQQL